MISIQRFFGKDVKIFSLLESGAEEARSSVQALKRLLHHPGKTASLEEFVESRRKEKQLRHDINEHVIKSFVAVLEREDVEALSYALHKIPKTLEQFAERYLICANHVQGADFGRQLALIEKAADQVVAMVKQLRKNPHLEKIKEENAALQRFEGEADKLILDLLRDLYGGKSEPLRVIALKELYELLEKVVDRCRDAGNVVTSIILKQS